MCTNVVICKHLSLTYEYTTHIGYVVTPDCVFFVLTMTVHRGFRGKVPIRLRTSMFIISFLVKINIQVDSIYVTCTVKSKLSLISAMRVFRDNVTQQLFTRNTRRAYSLD